MLMIKPIGSKGSALIGRVTSTFMDPAGFLRYAMEPSVVSYGNRRRGRSDVMVCGSRGPKGGISRFSSVVSYLENVSAFRRLTRVSESRCRLGSSGVGSGMRLLLPGTGRSAALIASVAAPKKRLLRGSIFLVSVPKFSKTVTGVSSSPVCGTVTRETSLVVFIRDSGSTVSGITGSFLRVLESGGRRMPIYLIRGMCRTTC